MAVVADVTVDRTTGRDQGRSRVCRARLRPDHQSRRPAQSDRRQRRADGEPQLVEKVTFSRSAVTSLNWGSYPILTFPNVPEVVIDLIDRPNEVPWGAGEPTTSVIPSAIANAVYDATGVWVRSVPFRPAQVLAALKLAKPG